MARVRVMFREPEVIFWVFFFPVLLAVVLGIAFSNPTSEAVPVVVEQGTSAMTFAEALETEPEIDVTIMDSLDASEALRKGEVALVVSGESAPVFRFDPTRSESRTARLLVDRALQGAAGAERPVTISEAEVRHPGNRYIDWLIPGLIGFNLMSTGLWGIGFNVTQARQNRQLKRLIATPMRRSDYLLSQVFGRFAFLVLEVPLLVIAAWAIFGVQIAGSVAALALVILLGAACFSGFGLLAGARPRTTEGVGGIINLIMMPMLILSGVFFSTTRFPDAIQPIIQILPLTALNDALRGIYNDGLSIFSLAPELVIVIFWMILTFVLALRWFRWQ